MQEIFYIKVRPDFVEVVNVDTGDRINSGDKLKFGNRRLLYAAEPEPVDFVKMAINKLSKKWFRLRLMLIVNPFHPDISEFTELEKMAFRDFASRIGATHCYLTFKERELSIGQITSSIPTFEV